MRETCQHPHESRRYFTMGEWWCRDCGALHTTSLTLIPRGCPDAHGGDRLTAVELACVYLAQRQRGAGVIPAPLEAVGSMLAIIEKYLLAPPPGGTHE